MILRFVQREGRQFMKLQGASHTKTCCISLPFDVLICFINVSTVYFVALL